MVNRELIYHEDILHPYFDTLGFPNVMFVNFVKLTKIKGSKVC